MNFGQLDRQITLQSSTEMQNEAGETVTTYQDVTKVWARVRQPSASEQVRNGVTNTVATYAIRIRYRVGIEGTWRVTYAGRTLEIASVAEIGRREAIDLIATELRS